jgi:hypothetical protein
VLVSDSELQSEKVKERVMAMETVTVMETAREMVMELVWAMELEYLADQSPRTRPAW